MQAKLVNLATFGSLGKPSLFLVVAYSSNRQYINFKSLPISLPLWGLPIGKDQWANKRRLLTLLFKS